jgi:hypothetical protein
MSHELGHGFQSNKLQTGEMQPADYFREILSPGQGDRPAILGKTNYEKQMVEFLGEKNFKNFVKNEYPEMVETLGQGPYRESFYSADQILDKPVELLTSLIQMMTTNPKLFKKYKEGVGADMMRKLMKFQGFATGGSVSGNDRVPAMLTPGEFIMSPEAVNKYGVGYMQSLNRGRVPGFRRGGIVGRGNVQYRQNGGGIADSNAMMSLDASNIQSVLETFNQQFQATLDTVVNQFSSLSNAMNNLAGVFGSGFTMTHTFTGDMSMAFKIDNLPELQQSIAKAITPTIVEQVKKVIDDQGKGFKAG